MRHWLSSEWTQHLCAAIESMTGDAVASESCPPDKAPAGSYVWHQGYSAGDSASAFVVAPAATWSAIGARALESAGIDDSTEDDQKGTYQEILNQAMSGLAATMARHLGREVLCQNGKEVPAAPTDPGQWISVTVGSKPPLRLVIHFSDALISALQGGEPAAPAPTAAPKAALAPAPPPPPLPAPSSAQSGPRGQTIELLYDVELPVSVSFGRANLPLKDALKLTSGSIVELNRSVTEPVEVIVNNCVVARGEVVVVEGNYGVRILQIVSQRERLRTVR
ncbi:MAG: flagellar motor switch protein FliN [Bryobacteraceae bacterium]